jgi:hypothetical protein
MSAVRRFAEACRYEKEHSEHVAMLSLRLFDQLCRVKLLSAEIGSAECRMLLEAAAVLHDIGYLVNYAKHHKHSMRLIANSEIDGLTPRQIAIVSNIARYHRRALPTKRHSAFSKLPPADRRVVAGLSAMLRVADGLDRAHSQIVKDIVIREKSSALGTWEIVIGASSSERPTTELWGAERKAGLLESELGVRMVFQWDTLGANEDMPQRRGPSVGEEKRPPLTQARICRVLGTSPRHGKSLSSTQGETRRCRASAPGLWRACRSVRQGGDHAVCRDSSPHPSYGSAFALLSRINESLGSGSRPARVDWVRWQER